MQRPFRILSLDGGGIKGIIPAIILASIEERTGKSISQLFDLIVGTSTGGILALGLTKPNSSGTPEFSAQHLCKLYERDIPHIFRNPQTWWGNLLIPKYRSLAFQQILEKSFGDCRFKEALTNVVIPCYDIEHRLPYIFKSRLAKQHRNLDFHMRDVALAASASPTLFSPVHIPGSNTDRRICLVDGGVFANNPAIIALSEIKSMSQDEAKDCLIVSLGTGKSSRPLTNEFVSLWGYVQWSRPMLELVMDSISESVHDQMKYILPVTANQQYHRLQVELPENIDPAIDNASKKNMSALSDAARAFCLDSESGEALDQLSKNLLRLYEENQTQNPSFDKALQV